MSQRNNVLLEYHMRCNPEYILEHATMAGKLAERKLKTYKEYVDEAKSLGINYWGEDRFNQFMGIDSDSNKIDN